MTTRRSSVTWTLFLLAAMMVSVSGAHADITKGRGGDHVPFPYGAANRKVELADGEFYTMIGRVLIDDTTAAAYLHVDLEKLPWLASKKRKEFPYYRLQGTIDQWSQYEGLRVRMNVQAMSSGSELVINLIPFKKSKLTILD